MAALEVNGLTKRYRNGVLANDNITLSVGGGEVFALLGPNGAGKTTLVRQVLALTRPTAGSIRVSGVDVVADPDAARRLCSYQPQNQVSLENLTPRQVISLIGRIRGLRKAEAAAATEGLLERLDMGEWATQRFGMLSGGLGRLTSFCAAAVAPGDVVVLDEPTNDVDPRRRRLLWDEVRALADRGHAVVLVTHNVLEAERAADRLAIIDKGGLAGFGSPGELKRDLAGTFRLEVVLDAGRLNGSELVAPGFVRKATRVGTRLVGEIAAPDAAKALGWVSGLRDAGTVEEFTLGPPTLEDVYLSATHG